jgi:hypothetical protein
MYEVEIERAMSGLAGRPFDRARFSFVFLETLGNKATPAANLVDGTLKIVCDSPYSAAANGKSTGLRMAIFFFAIGDGQPPANAGHG